MKISVRQRGGVLGLDREIQIEGARLSVTEKGARHLLRLDRQQTERIRTLAARVAEIGEDTVLSSAAVPSDDLATAIAIDDGAHAKRLTVHSGDSAPDALWELIDALEDVSGR